MNLRLLFVVRIACQYVMMLLVSKLAKTLFPNSVLTLMRNNFQDKHRDKKITIVAIGTGFTNNGTFIDGIRGVDVCAAYKT